MTEVEELDIGVVIEITQDVLAEVSKVIVGMGN